MITDGIMKIIYDTQEVLEHEISELEQEFKKNELTTDDYSTQRDILDAKLEVISELENKFGEYIGE